LTWIWSCLVAILILAFVMLSTRAALYNSIISKKKKYKHKLRPENVQKEFQEYKEFMADYYGDVEDWIMAPDKIEMDSAIKTNPTLETQTTGPLSQSEDSCADEVDSDETIQVADVAETMEGQVLDLDEDREDLMESDDESYSSDESSDSEDSEDDSRSEMMMSFISEAASSVQSLAARTIRSLRNLPTMLGNMNGSISVEDESIHPPESPYSSPNKSSLDRSNTFNAMGPSLSPGLLGRATAAPTKDRSMAWSPTVRAILGRLTPFAPRKTISAFRRTQRDEMEPLTPSQPPSALSPTNNEIVPRQLAMSPLLSPRSAGAEVSTPESSQKRQGRSAQEARHRRTSRVRLEASSDDEVSVEARRVIDSTPEAPQKAYKRISRTFFDSGKMQ
jgi:hypothetical protein